eukprot:5284173-Pleurochrysis_carterae.AAC.2
MPRLTKFILRSTILALRVTELMPCTLRAHRQLRSNRIEPQDALQQATREAAKDPLPSPALIDAF